MGIGDALRRLDDRVLGAARPGTTATHRNIFLIGLVGTLAVLIIVISTGESRAFAGVGGFVVFMIGGGVRWQRARQGARG